jgi:hypothetical protein
MALHAKSKKGRKDLFKKVSLAVVIALIVLVPLIRAAKFFHRSQKSTWYNLHSR